MCRVWGSGQPIKLPVMTFLSHFSSSFKIQIENVLRWDFLFSMWSFISLPIDLIAKRNVCSSASFFFPTVHYFSKLSLGLTQFVVSKILHSVKLWILLLQRSWKCFSVALYCHKSLKDRKTNFYAQLPYPKCSWDNSFVTPLHFTRG